MRLKSFPTHSLSLFLLFIIYNPMDQQNIRERTFVHLPVYIDIIGVYMYMNI